MAKFFMDYLGPKLVAWSDFRKYKTSQERLHKQAMTYVKQMDSDLKNKQQALSKRQLSKLKKKIAPLETQHDRFVRAVDDEKRKIYQTDGISDESKAFLLQRAENAMVYTQKCRGQKTELNIDKILDAKNLLCIEANARIDVQNEKIKQLHAIYRYRLAVYLRTLNNGVENSEISVCLITKPRFVHYWNYQTPFSSAVGEKIDEEELQNGNDNFVFRTDGRRQPEVA